MAATIGKSISKYLPSGLVFALSFLFMMAGMLWFGWTWATAYHLPVPLIRQGWPAPILFLTGLWLYTRAG